MTNKTSDKTILLYHISNGIFIGGGLEGGVTNLLKSLQGNNLRVLLVSDPDVMASNGVIHYMQTLIYPEGRFLEPTITKVTRVIEGEPTITKVTRVIEGEPTFTKVTRVIEGEPAITKVTRYILLLKTFL
uniref:Periostin, osteoblast specific factor b n=1 Tax=Paramormyrops kingsleyae TaxID=1676925 RepID=A0A3B3R9D6_9TELE